MISYLEYQIEYFYLLFQLFDFLSTSEFLYLIKGQYKKKYAVFLAVLKIFPHSWLFNILVPKSRFGNISGRNSVPNQDEVIGHNHYLSVR
jgi:hypothetical protein